MKIEDMINIIKANTKKNGYDLEIRPSVSTSSWYFKIYSGEFSLLFRIADHKTKSDVITLRTDKPITAKNLVSFVNNRCRDLGDRKLKILLGL